jgi:hypothetical protein
MNMMPQRGLLFGVRLNARLGGCLNIGCIFAWGAAYLGNKLKYVWDGLGTDLNETPHPQWTKVGMLLEIREQSCVSALAIKMPGVPLATHEATCCDLGATEAVELNQLAG